MTNIETAYVLGCISVLQEIDTIFMDERAATTLKPVCSITMDSLKLPNQYFSFIQDFRLHQCTMTPCQYNELIYKE
jgi:hypothetical protein